MPELPHIDTQYLLNFLTALLNTPSPTGFAWRAVDLTRQTLEAFPDLELAENRKGALLATWPGEDASADEWFSSPRALTAHLDTLGGHG